MSDEETDRKAGSLKHKLLWFGFLWLCGVAAVSAVGALIKAFIG